MKDTNLNMLFTQMIVNFAHLVTLEPQTKSQFLESIKKSYCLSNTKTLLFYKSTENSVFDTIRLSDDRASLLFNQ